MKHDSWRETLLTAFKAKLSCTPNYTCQQKLMALQAQAQGISFTRPKYLTCPVRLHLCFCLRRRGKIVNGSRQLVREFFGCN